MNGKFPLERVEHFRALEFEKAAYVQGRVFTHDAHWTEIVPPFLKRSACAG